MADIAGQIAAARKAGYSDADIARFLAKDPKYGAAITAATGHYSPTEVLNHFTPTEDTPVSPPKELKANNTLGFVNGGTHVFNRILGAGSRALQSVGAPADAVHAVGKVIRSGPLGAVTGSHMLNDQELAALNEGAARAGQRPGKLGVAAGQVAATVPSVVASLAAAPEAGATGLVANAGRVISGQGLGGAAFQGGLQGLQTGEGTDAGSAVRDATLGAAGGAAGAKVLGAVGAIAAPRFNGAMNNLINLGARRFTIGQLSGNRAIKTIEDASRSIPISGAVTANARDRAQQDFQRAFLQRAADEAGLGHTVNTGGHDAYAQLARQFSNRYDQLDNTVNLQPSATLAQYPGAANIMKVAVGSQEAANGGTLANRIDDLFNPGGNHTRMQIVNGKVVPGRTQTSALAGSDYKEVDKALRQSAKSLRNPGPGKIPPQQDLTQAAHFDRARALLRRGLTEQQPDVAAALTNADRGYAQFKRSQEAVTAASAGVDPASFTSKGLLNATMKAAGPNTKVTLGSAGQVPGQRIAEDAVSVYGSQVGDSGTASRGFVGKILDPKVLTPALSAGAAGTGVATHGASIVPTAIAMGLHALPYLPPVADAISNTLVGNSRNPLLVAARAAMDRPIPNAAIRAVANPAATVRQPAADENTYVGEDGNTYKFNPDTQQYERVQ